MEISLIETVNLNTYDKKVVWYFLSLCGLCGGKDMMSVQKQHLIKTRDQVLGQHGGALSLEGCQLSVEECQLSLEGCQASLGPVDQSEQARGLGSGQAAWAKIGTT